MTRVRRWRTLIVSRETISFILSSLTILGSGLLSPSDEVPSAEAHWKKLLSEVCVGMRRARVAKVLSRSDVALDFVLDPKPGPRKGRTAPYILDGEWCAAIAFDSTGSTTRNNPYLVLHIPENKVVASPQLLHRTESLNQRIEQAHAR